MSTFAALLGVLRSMFPDNIAVAAVDANILGVITFSLLFGLALAGLGPQADSFIALVHVSPFWPVSCCILLHMLIDEDLVSQSWALSP